MKSRNTNKVKKDSTKLYSKALYADEYGYCLTVLEYKYKDKSFDFVTDYFDLDKISFDSIITSIEDCEQRFSQRLRCNMNLKNQLNLRFSVNWENMIIDYQNDLIKFKAFLNDKKLRIDLPELKDAIKQYDPANKEKGHRIKALMLAIAAPPVFNQMFYFDQFYDSVTGQ